MECIDCVAAKIQDRNYFWKKRCVPFNFLINRNVKEISCFEIRVSNFLFLMKGQNGIALECLKTHPSNSLPFVKGREERSAGLREFHLKF